MILLLWFVFGVYDFVINAAVVLLQREQREAHFSYWSRLGVSVPMGMGMSMAISMLLGPIGLANSLVRFWRTRHE